MSKKKDITSPSGAMGVSLVADLGEANDKELLGCKTQTNDQIPILPLRDMVLFPGVFMPVSVGRESSLKLVKHAEKKKEEIFVVCQIDEEVDNPTEKDLYKTGVVARIVQLIDMPNNGLTAIVQGLERASLVSIDEYKPFLQGKVVIENEEMPQDEKSAMKVEMVTDVIREALHRYTKSSETLHHDVMTSIKNMRSPLSLVNFVCSNLPMRKDERIALLEVKQFEKRCYELLSILNREIELQQIRMSILAKTRAGIDQQQKEYFLQQQLRNIQEELGGGGQEKDVEELREKAKNIKWGEDIQKVFDKEVAKLERMNTQSPEYNVQLNYLQTLTSIPWNVYSENKNFSLNTAEKVLNKEHFGLEQVKERILEHLAVIKLKNDSKSPIICLYGPPGVGKTSLGKSIADSLKRKYVRMSLGGVHDESEIRGHRRTYIGAMPGRIIKGMIKSGSSNPVFILDEIDKLGVSRQGDPASALLEVLDPEQNSTFHDNYIDVDYDLSKVFFIATANNLNTIPAPLLDRMELIEVSGYITEEKVEIAKRHLLPKAIKQNGLENHKIKVGKNTLEVIIEDYTRESGVRELEKKINKLMRKIAFKIAKEESIESIEIKPEDLNDLIGVREYSRDKYQGNEYAGVVTGLAWTAVGGEILFIETSLSRGKDSQPTLTGNLGDVMKESAVIAYQYVKSNADELGIDSEIFNNWKLHIHCPEGATPKDGPSAGITMVTAIVSILTQRKVKEALAMTGEITLRGKVLPVGGIKEKILAAKRAGIKDIILSKENRKNVEEIKEVYRKGLTFHYVDDAKEVIKLALTDTKVKNCKDLTVIEKK